MTVIHLVRHGEVENPKGVIYGRLPGYHLSERGLQEARGAAEHLAEREIGAVWSSPLERARQTADAIAAPHGLEVVVDARITESHTTLEGVTGDLVGLLRNPTRWWRLRNPFRPSWGEAFVSIRKRMLAAIEDAAPAAGDKDVVLVWPQTPVSVARLALTRRNVPPWLVYRTCQTGSVTTLRHDGEVAVLESYFRPQ
jgi:broad specificity phosphatase PhoE